MHWNKKILQQCDGRHSGGVIVKSAFFLPPSCFRKPSSLMLAMALEPGQRKGGRKERRRGFSSPYAIWFSACLNDFCSFIWPRDINESAFPQKYCRYKLHTQAFSSLLPDCTQKQWWIKPNCLYSSDFANEWLCGIYPVSDALTHIPLQIAVSYSLSTINYSTFADFTRPSFRNT